MRVGGKEIELQREREIDGYEEGERVKERESERDVES